MGPSGRLFTPGVPMKNIVLVLAVLASPVYSSATEYEHPPGRTSTLEYISYPFFMAGAMYVVTAWHEFGHFTFHGLTGATDPTISIGPGPLTGSVRNSDTEQPSAAATYFRGIAGPGFSHAAWEITDHFLDKSNSYGTFWARSGGFFYLATACSCSCRCFWDGWMTVIFTPPMFARA